MKIVFFTNKNRRGACIIQALHEANIAVDAVIIESPPAHQPATVQVFGRKFRRFLQYFSEGHFDRIYDRLSDNLGFLKTRASRSLAWKSDTFYLQFSPKVYTVDNFNDWRTERILRELQPDLVVIGGARILKEHILVIPKVGLVNAHPGLLPKYRGESTMHWSLLNGDPVGVTVHMLDKGVDTGELLLRRQQPLTKSDTLTSLSEKLDDLAARMMVEAVSMLQSGCASPIAQLTTAGQCFRRMSRDRYPSVRKKLRQIQKSMSA